MLHCIDTEALWKTGSWAPGFANLSCMASTVAKECSGNASRKRFSDPGLGNVHTTLNLVETTRSLRHSGCKSTRNTGIALTFWVALTQMKLLWVGILFCLYNSSMVLCVS